MTLDPFNDYVYFLIDISIKYSDNSPIKMPTFKNETQYFIYLDGEWCNRSPLFGRSTAGARAATPVAAL